MSWKLGDRALIDGPCTVIAYFDTSMGELTDRVDFNAPTDQDWKEVRVISSGGFEMDMSAEDFDKRFIPLWREDDPS